MVVHSPGNRRKAGARRFSAAAATATRQPDSRSRPNSKQSRPSPAAAPIVKQGERLQDLLLVRDGDRQRMDLAAQVAADPSSPERWLTLLMLPSTSSATMFEYCRLITRAIEQVSTGTRSRRGQALIWIRKALVDNDPRSGRAIFKRLEDEGTLKDDMIFYESYATLEANAGNASQAKVVLAKGYVNRVYTRDELSKKFSSVDNGTLALKVVSALALPCSFASTKNKPQRKTAQPTKTTARKKLGGAQRVLAGTNTPAPLPMTQLSGVVSTTVDDEAQFKKKKPRKRKALGPPEQALACTNLPPPLSHEGSTPEIALRDDAEPTQTTLSPAEISSASPTTGQVESNLPPQKRRHVVDEGADVNHRKLRKLLEKTIVINGISYALVHLVGSGGSGKVYRAITPEGVLHAIKIITLTNLSDTSAPQVLQAAKNEVAFLRKIQGPGIIRVFDDYYDTENREFYVVMEHGDIDLYGYLFRLRRSDDGAEGVRMVVGLSEIRTLWEKMLRVLAHVHAHGIIHGDLKPENFLLVKGELKLIDFGLAQQIQTNASKVARDDLRVTIDFMSPEVIQGRSNESGVKVGRATDVWSLGCMLYEFVYGKPPFADCSMAEKLRLIPDISHEISFPTIENRQLEETLRLCLQRDYARRPTVEALLKKPF